MFMTFIAITGFAFSAVSVFWTASDRYLKWRSYLGLVGAMALSLVVGLSLGRLLESRVELNLGRSPRSFLGPAIVSLALVLAGVSYVWAMFRPLGPERTELVRGGFCFGTVLVLCFVLGGNFFFPSETPAPAATGLFLDDAETIVLADFNASRGDTASMMMILSARARLLTEGDPRWVALSDRLERVRRDAADGYGAADSLANPTAGSLTSRSPRWIPDDRTRDHA